MSQIVTIRNNHNNNRTDIVSHCLVQTGNGRLIPEYNMQQSSVFYYNVLEGVSESPSYT